MIPRVTFIFFVSSICFCQAQEDRPLPPLIEIETTGDEVRHTLFQKRALDPVIMDVRREINKVTLVAKNTAFFPYTLKIRFNKVRNLVPDPDSLMVFVVPRGTQVLMNLRIFDPMQSFDFDFKVDKQIGDSGAKPILDFPYLLPISKNKVLAVPLRNMNDTQSLDPVFMLKKGDTVHAMRKGIVTALPLTTVAVDRISFNSIEIRHLDGTIMVYQNIDPSKVLVQLGQTVYPGQPIGSCGSSELFVSLYDLQGEKLKELEILFYVNQDSVIPFSQISDGEKVQHPQEIIGKEMNRRELGRMKD